MWCVLFLVCWSLFVFVVCCVLCDVWYVQFVVSCVLRFVRCLMVVVDCVLFDV